MKTFTEALTALIRRHSLDVKAGMPDYLLAHYLAESLTTFVAVSQFAAGCREDELEESALSLSDDVDDTDTDDADQVDDEETEAASAGPEPMPIDQLLAELELREISLGFREGEVAFRRINGIWDYCPPELIESGRVVSSELIGAAVTYHIDTLATALVDLVGDEDDDDDDDDDDGYVPADMVRMWIADGAAQPSETDGP